MRSAKHNANICIVRVQKLGALIFVLLQTCLSVCPESAFLFIYCYYYYFSWTCFIAYLLCTLVNLKVPSFSPPISM